jgi:hypothetical protein
MGVPWLELAFYVLWSFSYLFSPSKSVPRLAELLTLLEKTQHMPEWKHVVSRMYFDHAPWHNLPGNLIADKVLCCLTSACHTATGGAGLLRGAYRLRLRQHTGAWHKAPSIELYRSVRCYRHWGSNNGSRITESVHASTCVVSYWVPWSARKAFSAS